MNRHRITATAILAAGLVALPHVEAQSVGRRNPFMMYGPITRQGTAVTCGAWNVADIEEGRPIVSQGQYNRANYTYWVFGFVSGATLHADMRVTDLDGIKGWITKYCREHPLDPLAEAAAELVEALRK